MNSPAQEIVRNIFRPSGLRRVLLFLVVDVFIAGVSLYLSFLMYFELHANIDYWRIVGEVLPYFVILKVVILALFRAYNITWRYFGIVDLFNMIVALAASSLLLAVAAFSWHGAAGVPFLSPLTGFPKSVIFMDFTVSLALLSLVRVSKRFYLEVVREKRYPRTGKRTIIIGAGNTGEMVLRDMQRCNPYHFHPIGFLDDDASKTGAYIHGVRVLGKLRMLESVIEEHEIKALIIAIPSLDRKTLGNLYSSARRLKVETTKTAPRIYDFDKPHVDLKNLEDISLEDLIGRQLVTVDRAEISDFLKGKRVLITGAGGSIGSEMATQVCGFKPARLMLFDIDETELHNLSLRLFRLFPESANVAEFITGDIRDGGRVAEVFRRYLPEVVFHAAAYKHVPMMEFNAGEAVKVNIFGTYTVAAAAAETGVEKFIMISTDKAVRPQSVMGATKRMAEYICRAYNDASGYPNASGLQCCMLTTLHAPTADAGRNGNLYNQANSELSIMKSSSTRFISVRFGNVLGSRGSVLPLFLDQLKYGGPLTVTHEDMKRYFMTIPEAVALVLQASVIGNGGEVLVLDMGEPVSITEIAEELVRMHGLEPGRDIDITYVGPRPGEKLFEEILTAEEGADASKHEKIYIARNGEAHSMEEIRAMLDEFDAVLRTHSGRTNDAIKDVLKKYVKHYEDKPGSKTGKQIPQARTVESGFRQCFEPVSMAEELRWGILEATGEKEVG